MLCKFSDLCCHLLNLFEINFFLKKIFHEKNYQTAWIQIRTDVLSVLIWVQTVCKGNNVSAAPNVAAIKERLNPYKPTVLFVGHRQTVQTQIRCLTNATSNQSQQFAYRMLYYNLNENEKYLPTTIETKMDWSNWLEWENPFG